MSRPTLRGAQISLRFDVVPEHVAAYIAAAVAQLALDFFLCTEGRGRAAAVRRALGPDWRVVARGEYLIGTRRSALARWRLLPLPRLRTVKGADWSNGPHAGTRHFAGLFGNYRIRATSQRLRLIVAHATSGVQVGEHFSHDRSRVDPYRRGVRQLGVWLRRTQRTAPQVVQVIGLDSNTEQHLQAWRDFLEHELGLRSMWRDSRPAAGTHGSRLIDTLHSNAAVSGQDVVDLDRDPGLDHDLATAVFHPDHLVSV